MFPRTRAEAREAGFLHYCTGKPCKRGHFANRLVSSQNCLECLRLASAELRKTPKGVEARRRRESKPEYLFKKREYHARPETKAKINKRVYERKKNDLSFRISDNLRTRVRRAVVRKSKSSSAILDLGCSMPEFLAYVESLWSPGMSWENYGVEWHLDHKVALGLFDLTDPEQFRVAAHYSNLQPLGVEDHRVKTRADVQLIRSSRERSADTSAQGNLV